MDVGFNGAGSIHDTGPGVFLWRLGSSKVSADDHDAGQIDCIFEM